MNLFVNLLLYLVLGCFLAYFVRVWKEFDNTQSYGFFKFISFVGSLYCFFMIYLTISDIIFLFFLDDLKSSGMSFFILFLFVFFGVFVVPMIMAFKTVRILTASGNTKNKKPKDKNKLSA